MLIIYIIIPLLLSIMLYTLAERKVQALIQHRIGPNQVGIYGIIQPLIDGVKLLLKEILIPQHSYLIIFCLSPILSFVLSLCLWFVIQLVDSYITILLILSIGGLEIYGILLGGWSSQNKYTLVGSIRTTCQLVSYELILSMIYFIIILSLGSFRFSYIYILPILPIYVYLPIYIISLIVILAETNRVPFDLPESESETVAGFFVEHSAIIFALYFLAEYSNMIFLSYLFSILFTCSLLLFPIHLFYFIWIRATLPRLRYDHLILLCWYNLLPIVLGYLIFTYSIIFTMI